MPSRREPVDELRDDATARAWLHLGASISAQPTAIRELALRALLVSAEAAEPVLPVGVAADIAAILFRSEDDSHSSALAVELPLSASLVLRYQDQFLSRLRADDRFQRAADASLHDAPTSRARTLAFAVSALRTEMALGGMTLPAGIIRSLLKKPSLDRKEATTAAERSAAELLQKQYVRICEAARASASVLSPVDLYELETGLAVSTDSHRLALRQALLLVDEWNRDVAWPSRPRSAAGQHSTRIPEEQQFPVGGYASLSTRGSLESLLHSQLAFMERESRPDLFDVRFLRDELLYFSRDENQLHRPATTAVLLLRGSLQNADVQDSDGGPQRLVRIVAFVLTLIRRLTQWYCDESLQIELILPDSEAAESIEWISSLLKLGLKREIERDLVRPSRQDGPNVERAIAQWRRARQILGLELRAGDDEPFLPIAVPVVQFDRPAPRVAPQIDSRQSDEISIPAESAWRDGIMAAWSALVGGSAMGTGGYVAGDPAGGGVAPGGGVPFPARM